MPAKGELAIKLGATDFVNAAEVDAVAAIHDLLPFKPGQPVGPSDRRALPPSVRREADARFADASP